MVHPSDRVFMTASGHGSGMPMRGTGRRAEQVMRGGETFQLSLLPDRTDLVTRAQSSAKVDLGATAAPRTRPAPTPGPYARSGKKACHGDRKAVTPLNEKGPATLAFHKVGLTGFEPATPCAEFKCGAYHSVHTAIPDDSRWLPIMASRKDPRAWRATLAEVLRQGRTGHRAPVPPGWLICR